MVCRKTKLQVQVMDPQKAMEKKNIVLIILTSSYSLHLPFLPEHVISLVQRQPGKHQACNQSQTAIIFHQDGIVKAINISNFHLMCSSRKYSYSPQGRLFVLHPLNLPPPLLPGNSSLATYFSSKSLDFKTPPPRNFQRPSVGGVWILSGTTQFSNNTQLCILPPS